MDNASTTKQNPDERHEHRVVGFICNWNGYTGVEMAGVEGLEYPACLRLIRVMCLGRLHLGILLQAFELGADGVLFLGCPPRECHYGHGSEQARELAQEAKKILNLLGADPRRVEFVEIPLGGADVFAKQINTFINYIEHSEPAALAASRATVEIAKEESRCER